MTETILLPPRLDTTALRSLAQDLSSAACAGRDIDLDARDVTHMGALSAQLFIAAARDARAKGGTLTFGSISERAVDQLAMMGLTPTRISEGAK